MAARNLGGEKSPFARVSPQDFSRPVFPRGFLSRHARQTSSAVVIKDVRSLFQNVSKFFVIFG